MVKSEVVMVVVSTVVEMGAAGRGMAAREGVRMVETVVVKAVARAAAVMAAAVMAAEIAPRTEA